MRIASLSRAYFVVCLSLVVLATSSHAGTILQFTQLTPADGVTATANGGITTLSVGSPTGGNSLPVLISVPGTGSTPLTAYENFVKNPTSTDSVTTIGGFLLLQPFSGQINFTSGANDTGTLYLRASFTNAIFGGAAGGSAAFLVGSEPGLIFPHQTVSFASSYAPIEAAIAGNNDFGFSLALSAISPVLTTTDGTISSFFAQNAGSFSAVIPEPQSIIMAAAAGFAGVVCCLWRRRKSYDA